MLSGWATGIAQLLVILALAPGLQGLIQRVKAMMQGRHGPGVLQPYFTLAKQLRRQDVRPPAATFIFRAVPRLALAAVLAGSLAVPLLWSPAPLGWGGDLIAVIGFLALERYITALAGLDQGTPFGGLGSSRQVTIGALVEPALFALALPWLPVAGSTAWPALIAASAAAPATNAVRFFALAAGLIVVLAETGRLPVDNPDTHLELTMIHEAITLEYAGPQLALLSLAQMLKQLLVIALVLDLLLPWGAAGPLGPAVTLLKWGAAGVGLGVAESLSAKLRFFRLPAYLGASAALSSAAAVIQVWGGR